MRERNAPLQRCYGPANRHWRPDAQSHAGARQASRSESESDITGPLGGDTRQTPIIELPDGSSLQLRFTRFNVAPDRFESRMERSTDGGKTWTPGNRQVFERQPR